MPGVLVTFSCENSGRYEHPARMADLDRLFLLVHRTDDLQNFGISSQFVRSPAARHEHGIILLNNQALKIVIRRRGHPVFSFVWTTLLLLLNERSRLPLSAGRRDTKALGLQNRH